jgi:replicative DNA helicase
VDYLGLVQNKGNFERNDLKQSDITSKLAQLAIELNCIVIALSQINRGASNRGAEDRCPWPHDAADSSGGHRSSSLWLGVDRPELYQDDPCYRNQFVVKCRKNRFGNTFDLIFAFNEGTFAEVQSGWFRQPMKQPRNAEQALFSAHSKDFSEKQYID